MSYGKVNKSTGERIPYAGSAAAITPSAEYIDYDNTTSGLQADDVQDAIDELVSEKKDEYTTITYAQWQQLTPAQQAAKDYYISDYPSSAITAGNVSYNNSSSGMVANNVQSAVDELKNGLTNAAKFVNLQAGQSITVNGNQCLVIAKRAHEQTAYDVNAILFVINGGISEILNNGGQTAAIAASYDSTAVTTTITNNNGVAVHMFISSN